MNSKESEDTFWELIFSLDLKKIKVPLNGNGTAESYRNMQDDPLVKTVVDFYAKKS